ncbi:hypothetical protein LPJ66_009835 [Kickxella alabastrina]|uniref:Uncharacterized protein n=1 Tax=Kickxella alabastrina TaxID=61397 RepID=A0ACC1I258_9FUNG|nr:hypothetical protein LPJ66_009835 [Kickxella alabastrina]
MPSSTKRKRTNSLPLLSSPPPAPATLLLLSPYDQEKSIDEPAAVSLSTLPTVFGAGVNEFPGCQRPDTSAANPKTLAAPARALCFDGYPARVTGAKPGAGSGFAVSKSQGHIVVDKTLVCRGFWDVSSRISLFCLPRRFGKSFNLSVIRMFFSSRFEQIDTGRGHMDNGTLDLDLRTDLLSKNIILRKNVFIGSLLRTLDPAFFEEHFAKYPVVFLDFSSCRSATAVGLIKKLCAVFASQAVKWIKDLEENQLELSILSWEAHERVIEFINEFARLNAASVGNFDIYALLITGYFPDISEFVGEQYGKYILLIDGYDTPFLEVEKYNWDSDTKIRATKVMIDLFQIMLKTDEYVLRGLVMGVFNVPLYDGISGADNVFTISVSSSMMYGNISEAGVYTPPPPSMGGSHAFIDSFGFNDKEILLLIDKFKICVPALNGYEHVAVDTIHKWYNGYYIAEFKGKLNPWSVCMYLMTLEHTLNHNPKFKMGNVIQGINSAAKRYWADSTFAQKIDIELICPRDYAFDLAARLIRDFAQQQPGHTIDVGPGSDYIRYDPIAIAHGDHEPKNEPGYYDMGKCIGVFLSAGYLTFKTPTLVCIPNLEAYYYWRSNYMRTLFGPYWAKIMSFPRSFLLSDLWNGRLSRLCLLVGSGIGVFNSSCLDIDKQYAIRASMVIIHAARLGVLCHPNEANVQLSNINVHHYPGPTTKHNCLVITLPNHLNMRDRFGLVVQFKYVADDKQRDIDYIRRCAEIGLAEVNGDMFSMELDGCIEYIRVFLVIGDNCAFGLCRIYQRPKAVKE